MLPTSPATTLPWAWRLFRASDSHDERFLIAFLHAQSQGPSNQDWSCDEVARTEDEARAYGPALRRLPGQFYKCFEAAPGLVRRRELRLERPHPGAPFRFARSPRTRALGLIVRSKVSLLTLTSPNRGR